MIYDTTPIKNYILYLKKECNLSITLHPTDALLYATDLITFNIHDNPYCIYVKTCKQAQEHCIKKQSAVVAACACGSYSGTCHAGVREYVYPIMGKGVIKGFISVSGYADKHGEEYVSAISRKYAFPKKELSAAYRTLKTQMPDKKIVDTLLIPLCQMLELFYLQADTTAQDESFISKILRFLKCNYTQAITSKTLCKEFACSRSHLSHTFNQTMGTTLKDYLNVLRVEGAKQLLHSSELNITEIAFSTGFSDSNYFANVFKKHTGMSPSTYRKYIRSEQL